MERPRWTTGHRAGLTYHRRLLDDYVRMDAYERAIRALVRPGDVVLDLGAGTGILSLLAARCGAARVHAVESMPVARLARDLARHNGFADRIVVHEAEAATLAPVEPVDLVIGDFMGCWVVDDGMLPAVEAAGRWLAPGGRFCPRRLTLRLAPAGNLVLDEVDAFRGSLYGLDLSPATERALRACYRGDLARSMILAPAVAYAELVPPDVNRSLDGAARFTIETPGELRAVAGWFEAELAPGVALANAPGGWTHWGQHLFPLPPTDVQAGDTLDLSIRVLTDRERLEWMWSGRITRGGREIAAFAFDSTEPEGGGAAPPAVRDLDVDALNARGVEAFGGSRWREAARDWGEAIAMLDARDDRLPALYENLGMAFAHAGRRSAAIRAFLRAVDGDLRSREQAQRFLHELGYLDEAPSGGDGR